MGSIALLRGVYKEYGFPPGGSSCNYAILVIVQYGACSFLLLISCKTHEDPGHIFLSIIANVEVPRRGISVKGP